jgi:sigma-E factor negative regulatory protein RseC
MISEAGRVVAVTTQSVWVETIQQSSCGACKASKGCGQGLLNEMYDGRRNHIEIQLDEDSPADLQVNDEVEICLSEQTLLMASSLVYLLPLIGLIGGGLLGQQLVVTDLVEGELLTVLGSMAGFVAGLLLARWSASMQCDRPANRPKVLAVRSRSAGTTSLGESVSL